MLLCVQRVSRHISVLTCSVLRGGKRAQFPPGRGRVRLNGFHCSPSKLCLPLSSPSPGGRGRGAEGTKLTADRAERDPRQPSLCNSGRWARPIMTQSSTNLEHRGGTMFSSPYSKRSATNKKTSTNTHTNTHTHDPDSPNGPRQKERRRHLPPEPLSSG